MGLSVDDNGKESYEQGELYGDEPPRPHATKSPNLELSDLTQSQLSLPLSRESYNAVIADLGILKHDLRPIPHLHPHVCRPLLLYKGPRRHLGYVPAITCRERKDSSQENDRAQVRDVSPPGASRLAGGSLLRVSAVLAKCLHICCITIDLMLQNGPQLN